LPPALLAARHQHQAALLRAQAAQHGQQHARAQASGAGRRVGLWLLFVMVPMLLTGVAVLALVLFAHNAGETIRGARPAPRPAEPTPPERPPPSKDDRSSGMLRMTALMKEASAKGCKRVVMAPQTMQGGHQLTWTAVTGSCVRFFATTGVSDNPIGVELRTPFGERIQTPAASVEIDFTECPKNKGPHRLNITPATDDYYTVGSVECPMPKSTTPRKRAR